MKKWILTAGLLLALSGAAVARDMSVQVREGELRNRPSFLGTLLGKVADGDRVSVQQQQAGWTQVKTASGQTGWIHDSALTTKRVVLSSAGGGDVRLAASGEEVALAGKGFNAEVEAAYKQQHRSLDYTWVDRMLTYKVSDARIIQFLQKGGLAQ